MIGMFLETVERLPAQSLYRESFPSENVAASEAIADLPYNIALGPVNIRTAASISATYNSNINLSASGTQSDIILQPAVDISGLWQVTELNSLSFDLGVGYQEYLYHSQNSGPIISPSSGAQFTFFLGDARIKLSEDFSFLQDPIAVGQLSNVAQFSRFLNTAAVTASWDLGDIVLSLEYAHSNLWVFQNTYQYLSYQSDTVSPSFTYHVNETIQAGFNTSVSSTRYEQNIQNNNFSVTAGPFVTAQISDFLSVNAQIAGIYTNYDQGGLNGDTENIGSWIGSAGVTHKINDVLTQSVTVGKEYLPGITSNFTQRVYVNYVPTWQATSYLNISSNLWYENLNDSNATIRQESNRYGIGVNVGWAATEHATLSAGYQYVLKNADAANVGYTQNQATLALRYQF
jgi:hypothetical protein